MHDLLVASIGGTIRLHTVLAPGVGPAMVDPTQLESIILNLAINARDAMSPGGTLTIETFNAIVDNTSAGAEQPTPGEYVGLAVIDTGVGIPEDLLPRVFEPFFTTKEPGKGSGLGLAQVFGFAKQSGGDVEIKSRVGQGTSVRVFLPRAGEAVRGQHDAGASKGRKPDAMANIKIMVVDDDPPVLGTTVRMLHAIGYATVAAASGAEALRLMATDSHIDLVMADFAMPDMTGAQLAEAVHRTYPTVRVLLVTGYGGREALKQVGDARFLQKPYSNEDLEKRIVEALN